MGDRGSYEGSTFSQRHSLVPGEITPGHPNFRFPDTRYPQAVVEPLLPRRPPLGLAGRPGIDDRAALAGVLFVLKTGIPWEKLPQEMGCESGMTCWRRLKEWHEARVWDRLQRTLFQRRVRKRIFETSVYINILSQNGALLPQEKTRPGGAD